MSELLNELLDANAFVPSPLVEDLLICHVPFDELASGSDVEAAMRDRAERGRAIALVGPSGSGKSATTAYALDQIAGEFAPIRIPVAYETDETVTDPGHFGRYVLQRLLKEAEQAEALEATDREKLLLEASERIATPSRTIGSHKGLSLELPWLLKGDAARDVSTTIAGANLAGSTNDVLGAIDRTIEAIEHSGLHPIIVLDDTDRWLQVGDLDRRPLVGRFFGVIVRMLAERGCGLVVAVHDSYLKMPEYVNGTNGFLTDRLDLPALEAADQVAQILDHRIKIQTGDAWMDVFDPGAVDRLFAYYEATWDRSIRWILQIAHSALTEAVSMGAEQIDSGLIDATAASYAPG